MADEKKTLYVGGLDEHVNERILSAAFVTFGEIKEISMPVDPGTNVHRSFAFIEFDLAEDAAHALDNMNNAEFYGKVLKINYSRPQISSQAKAVWAEDEYYKEGDAAGDKKENGQGPEPMTE